MRITQALIAVVSSIGKNLNSAVTVRFKLNFEELANVSCYLLKMPTQVLQFNMPGDVGVSDYYQWYSRSITRITPRMVEIFNRVFKPQISALRADLPKYFCQPLLEGDELRIAVDLFSDRLEDILDRVRADVELAEAGAPTSSLVRMALFMILPPLWSDKKFFVCYYPQELFQIVHNNEQYRSGRKKWREALEKARKSGLKYEGPVPEVVRQPAATIDPLWQNNCDNLPNDIWLYTLCMTGPYIWCARLVCKKWRIISAPHAIVGILGYKGAFKILSGRATYNGLVTRLDSLAQVALDEFVRTSSSAQGADAPSLDGGPIASTGVNKWGGIVGGLREIVQVIDPYHVLSWYRDAQPKLPGLDKMIEADVFALFTTARNGALDSTLLEHTLNRHPVGAQDPSWHDDNQHVVCRMVKEYFKKYPEVAGGHPLPDDDSLDAWVQLGRP